MQSFLLGLAKTLFSAKMMVSDEKIAKRLFELLEIADLTTATTSAIRRQLEQELGIDLRDKKAIVREQVNLYLQTHHQNQQEEDEEEATAVKAEAEKDGGEEAAEEDEDEDVEEEEEGEEEEEEVERKPEQDSRRLQAKINRVKKDSLQKEKKKRSGGGGFAKLCRLSPELQSVMGEKELSRTQVVKFLWIYIREKNLQDPGNKRKIICDDALRAVFGTESTDMFKMNKLLTKHIWPLDSLGDEGDSKPKRPKIEKEEAPQKEGGKARGGGFMAPLPISEALIQFLGTGESELSRSEVVRRMWAYIKENELQTLQWGPKYGLVASVQTLFHSRNLDTIFCRGRDTLCSDLACTGTIIPITKEFVFPARSDCHAAQKF